MAVTIEQIDAALEKKRAQKSITVADIDAALARKRQPQQEDDTFRNIGLGARALAQGITTPVTFPADLAALGVNKLAGRDIIAQPSRIVSEGLTAMGLPEAQTQNERLATATIEGVTGGGAFGKAARGSANKFVQSLGTKPGIDAAAGGGAALSSQAAAEAGFGPVGQLTAGFVGGGFTATGASKAAGKLGRSPVNQTPLLDDVATRGLDETQAFNNNFGSLDDSAAARSKIAQPLYEKALQSGAKLDINKNKVLFEKIAPYIADARRKFRMPTPSEIKDPLVKKAKKFKTFDDFLDSIPPKQDRLIGAMDHRPTKTGANASNVTQEVSDMGFPKDFYKNPQNYENMLDPAVKESFDVLNRVRNNPNAVVTIYRASPKKELRNGDWVTLSKEYAKRESLQEGVKVHSYKVKAKEIDFAGDSINEFGFWGHGSKEKEALKNIYNQSKTSGEGVTNNSIVMLDAAKKSLDEKIGKAISQGERQEARAMQEIKNELVSKLDDLNPDYKKARQVSSDLTSAQNAQQQGLQLFKRRPQELKRVSKAPQSEPFLLDDVAERGLDETQAFSNVRSELVEQAQKENKRIGLLFERAKKSGENAFIASDDLKSLSNDLSDNIRKVIDADGKNFLTSTSKTIDGLAVSDDIANTVNELQSFRRQASKVVRKDGPGSEGAKVVLEKIDDFLENVNIQGDTKAASLWKKAIESRRDFGRRFEDPAKIAKAIDEENTIESVEQLFLGTGSVAARKDAAKVYDDVLKAVEPQKQKQIGFALRQSVLNKMINNAAKVSDSSDGLSASRLSNSIRNLRRDNQSLWRKFTPYEKQTLAKLETELRKVSKGGALNKSYTAIEKILRRATLGSNVELPRTLKAKTIVTVDDLLELSSKNYFQLDEKAVTGVVAVDQVINQEEN